MSVVLSPGYLGKNTLAADAPVAHILVLKPAFSMKHDDVNMFSLICAWTNVEQTAGLSVIWDTTALIMTSL